MLFRSSDGWTLVFNEAVDYSAGTTNLNISDFKAFAGEVIGFYIYCANGEVETSGTYLASNSDLSIGAGENVCNPPSVFNGSIDETNSAFSGSIYYDRVTCETPAQEVFAVVNTPPAIGAQPSTSSACDGETISIDVEATGTDLTYQWRKGGGNLSDVGDISGSATSSLTITTAVAGDNGAYDVSITNSCGSVLSDAVNLTVSNNPYNVIDPANTTGCPGSTVYFETAAEGVSLSYQWQTDAGGSWANVADATPTDVTYSGAASSELTIVTGASTPETVYNYRCIISSSCPGSVTTSTATMTIVTGTAVDQPGPITGAEGVCNTSPTGQVYTIGAVTGADSYLWTVPSGATITSTTTALSATIDFIANFHDTIQVQAVNGCGPGIPRKLDVMVGNVWNGTSSRKWETGANWCTGSEPTASDNVYIPFTGITNFPFIDGTTGKSYCKDFEMEASAYMDITPDLKFAGFSPNTNVTSLFVYGDFENNGRIDQNYFSSKWRGIPINGVLAIYLLGNGCTISGTGSFDSDFLQDQTGKGMIWITSNGSYTLKADLPYDQSTKLHDIETFNTVNGLDLNGFILRTNSIDLDGSLTVPNGSKLILSGVDGAFPWNSANEIEPTLSDWQTGSTFVVSATLEIGRAHV